MPANYPRELAFDVIFALSFFSHMPPHRWGAWLETLYDRLVSKGHLVFTTQDLASRKYLGDPELPPSGIWYAAKSEQTDLDTAEYGQTIVTTEYVVREVRERIGDARILMIWPSLWWGHQDLYVAQRLR